MKLFFLVFCSFIIFCSCSNKYENILKNNTAEVREFVLEGKSDNINASLICGLREKDYVINGYATELIEFGILTFDIENINDYNETIATYVLLVGTVRYDGDLQKNPFDNTLVADIKTIINSSENVTAKIIIGDFTQEIKLKNVCNNWSVDSEEVYKIVAKNFKDDIKQLIINNVFNGEVYVKIINDADINVGDYYWYVNIVNRTGRKLSLIISPHTSEILAVNNTLNK